jgi:hypothetical protein
MDAGGEPEVELYDDSVLAEHFGEFSATVESSRVTGEANEAFKEYVGFCTYWMLLQQNIYAVSKVRGGTKTGH